MQSITEYMYACKCVNKILWGCAVIRLHNQVINSSVTLDFTSFVMHTIQYNEYTTIELMVFWRHGPFTSFTSPTNFDGQYIIFPNRQWHVGKCRSNSSYFNIVTYDSFWHRCLVHMVTYCHGQSNGSNAIITNFMLVVTSLKMNDSYV